MQTKLFYNFTKETFAPAWEDYKQKQINMKNKKKPAIKAKKRIRFEASCTSIEQKEYLQRAVINAKKRFK